MLGFTRVELAKGLIVGVLAAAAWEGIKALVPVFVGPGVVREVAIVAFGLVILIGALAVFIRWIDRRQVPAVPTPSGASPMGSAQVFPPSIGQEPTESILRKKWEDAEARVASAETHARTVDRAREELKERAGRLHRALDIAVTWLYRRENWDGLTEDGRNSEPAPKDIWADSKYAQLGLNGVAYQPPSTVPSEPGFRPREREASHAQLTVEQGPSAAQRALHQVTAVGGTDVTCSCGWRGPGPQYEPHKLAPFAEDEPEEVRGMGFAPERRIPLTITGAPIAHQATPLVEFCSTRSALLARGRSLVDELWQVSTNAKRVHEQEWRGKVTAWRNGAKAHHQKWWIGEAYSPKIVARKGPALHPPWRSELQNILTSELRWLEEYGWGCPEANAPSVET